MPLFKGQGCKSIPSKAISYIMDKKKAIYVSSRNLDDSRSYAVQFRETAQMYEKCRRYEERKYYHFKLSCDHADEVSAEAHQEYAEALAEKLFAGYECVIATHTDTNTIHSHIIVNAVSFETGKKLDIRNASYGRMKDVANQLGIQRGFTPLDFRKPARERITTPELRVELKGDTSWKEELREVIQLAKQDTKTMQEFENYLKDYGITLTRNTEKTIAYKHPKKEKSIRGEKLGADYTKGAITNELEQNRWSNSQRTVAAERAVQPHQASTGIEPTKPDRIGEQLAEGSLSFIERELRRIDEAVKSRTSEGRAEQAERCRMEQADYKRPKGTGRESKEQQRATSRHHISQDWESER